MSYPLYIITYNRGTHWDTGRQKAYHWAFLIEVSASNGIKHELRGMPGAYFYPGPEKADPKSEEPGKSISVKSKIIAPRRESKVTNGDEGLDLDQEKKEDEEDEEDEDEEEDVLKPKYELGGRKIEPDEDEKPVEQIVVVKLELGSIGSDRLEEFEKICQEAYIEKEEVKSGDGIWNCQNWCLGVLEGMKGKDVGKDVWYGGEEVKSWLKEKSVD